MKKNLIFIIAISFVGILAMSGCGCGISEPTGSLNGNGYVDLGLPSGTLWATCNIGADEPNDVGSYFAYGETTPKWMYFDDNYSYRFRTNTLQPSDDAATYNWGNNWRMPTDEDFEELKSSCRWEWTSHNFQKGYKITGPNGNSIFLPTTGVRSIYEDPEYPKNGNYRTSSASFIKVGSEQGWIAITFYFSDKSYSISEDFSRASAGVTIRPVSSGNGSSKTSSVKETKTKGSCNGHDWVDLGLPSGTKWATCNVGANKPEDDGNYYAWGETRTKDSYSHDNYSWGIRNNYDYIKYGYADNLKTLEANDDAATTNWGHGWHMPTETELQELISNCTYQWTTQNDVKGMLFTGTNGNSIFLPAAGDRFGSELKHAGTRCYYWSSSLCSAGPSYVWSLIFDSGNCRIGPEVRNDGFTVRPVCQP